MPKQRNGIYISSPDDGLRWELRRAALEERVTVQALVTRVLTDLPPVFIPPGELVFRP